MDDSPTVLGRPLSKEEIGRFGTYVVSYLRVGSTTSLLVRKFEHPYRVARLAGQLARVLTSEGEAGRVRRFAPFDGSVQMVTTNGKIFESIKDARGRPLLIFDIFGVRPRLYAVAPHREAILSHLPGSGQINTPSAWEAVAHFPGRSIVNVSQILRQPDSGLGRMIVSFGDGRARHLLIDTNGRGQVINDGQEFPSKMGVVGPVICSRSGETGISLIGLEAAVGSPGEKPPLALFGGDVPHVFAPYAWAARSERGVVPPALPTSSPRPPTLGQPI
ncbi:hypothetical protein FJZ48_01140 [Candidatus Uhrbacteria bacterium]|nr:hypothetical protein [Candidatus Uhrbacteria bacterium]